LTLTHYMIDILGSAFAIPFSKAFPLPVNYKPDPKPSLFLWINQLKVHIRNMITFFL